MKINKQSNGIEQRALSQCPYQDCNQGQVKGLFHSLAECHHCNGLGLVDGETGEALPDREIIRQLICRLSELKAKAVARIRELERSHQYLQARLMKYEQGR